MKNTRVSINNPNYRMNIKFLIYVVIVTKIALDI